MTAADPPPAPFVIGVSRSGTTLLRLMLDAHPELAIPAETHLLGDLVPPAPPRDARGVADVIVAAPTWPNLHLDEAELRAALAALDPFSTTDAIRTFYRLCAARFGTTRWGDKTPAYREHLPAIAAVLPEAHFIHLVRDGRDVAVSYRGLWFGPGDDPATAGAFWAEQVRRTRAHGATVPHYREVRYEELVADPERVLRDLCAYLELDFDDRMLRPEAIADARLADLRASLGPPGTDPVPLERFLAIHERSRRPVDASRVGRWRHELAPDEVAAFEQVAGPALQAFGYPLTPR